MGARWSALNKKLEEMEKDRPSSFKESVARETKRAKTYTADDIEQRFAHGAQRSKEATVGRLRENRAALSQYQRSERVKLLGAGVLGAVLVATAVSFSAANDSVHAETASITDQFTTAEQELGSARAENAAIPKPTTVRKQLAAADAAGKDMAALQNKYINLGNVSVEESSAAGDERGVIRTKLAKHFTEESLPNEATDLDPASPWFVASLDPHSFNKEAKRGTDVASWTYQSAQLTEDGVIEAVWLCHDQNGRLLEWARSQYQVDDGQFHGLTRGQTADGTEMVEQIVNQDHGHDHDHGSQIDTRNEQLSKEGS